ncbi:MAG TPA: 50S ribosomal protein L13 [Patescibacteria group bacterium]
MIGSKVKYDTIKRNWHLFDANEEYLGRLASKSATLLMGKNKSYFVPHLDCGDYVVILNAENLKVSGSKDSKPYYRHSGYPGGIKMRTLGQLRETNPEEIIRNAIIGMLPKSKLGRSMVKKLYVVKGKDNPYKNKFKD